MRFKDEVDEKRETKADDSETRSRRAKFGAAEKRETIELDERAKRRVVLVLLPAASLPLSPFFPRE